MRCRRIIGMHQWYKLLRKPCIFFCFRARTYSHDEYFCIVVPDVYVVVLYTCVSYFLYVVCDMLLLICAAPVLTPPNWPGIPDFAYFFYFFFFFCISTYSIDNGCIQQAMVQCDLTTGVHFNFYSICKPKFSNFELERIYMHPCLLVSLAYMQVGGVFM